MCSPIIDYIMHTCLNTYIQKWTDCRFKWNPNEHEGVDVLIVKESSIWIPDIELYDR